MKNIEYIKNMNDEEMANFINLTRPSCNEICEEAKDGCAYNCKYKCGKDIILRWLNEER